MTDEQAGRKLPRKNLPTKRHDWETVRAHFIEHTEQISFRDLANAYNIPYQSVKDRAAAERWTYLRAEHQSTVVAKAQKDRIKRLLDESENFDEASLKAAKLGQGLIAGRMAQMAAIFAAQQNTFNNAVQRLKGGQPVAREELYSPIYSKEIIDLANALERFQNVGRRALGTDVQKFEHEVSGTVEHEHELSISDEVGRFDADRMASFLAAAMRAGVPIGELAAAEYIEGEVEDDEQQQPQQPYAEDVTGHDNGDDG